MKSITEQLNELHTDWKNRFIGQNYIEDGIIDEQAWLSPGRKIMVLLKEPHSRDYGWKYQDFILRRGYLEEGTSTWANLLRWTYGMLHGFPPYQEVDEAFHDIKENSLHFFGSVCFANIKKIAGASVANDKELIAFSDASHPFILKQISILEPSIVLCCGGIVFDIVRKSLDKEKIEYERKFTSGGLEVIWWKDKRINIVRYFHPMAHIPKEISYTYLIHELRQIL
ncbi:hypothetical protein [Paenibacillus ihumii]|uniref:hypothetical protein n=1 Tax=Paenibacillus ihumii TaxID=687436 RepID=UPI0006D7FC69|nr:hypothetical protein [Paenibacillus ihumii]